MSGSSTRHNCVRPVRLSSRLTEERIVMGFMAAPLARLRSAEMTLIPSSGERTKPQ